jgi:hypothetical protein
MPVVSTGDDVPHFTLITREGDTLSAVELRGPDWPDGSIIYRGGDEPNLRVVGFIEPRAPENFDVLVVERVPIAPIGRRWGATLCLKRQHIDTMDSQWFLTRVTTRGSRAP